MGERDSVRNMKIIVVSTSLRPEHIKKIEDAAAKVNAKLLFTESEDNIPVEFQDADVVYGIAMNIAKTYKSVKWMCTPNAGVDLLMKPGAFANEDCILTNSAGAYGVSIAEHIIAVTLMMMRKITLCYAEAVNGVWGPRRQQDSIKDSRITVLGTGDIGRTFARRAKGFEPKTIIGVSRSGKSSEPAFDRMYKTEELDKVLPETDLLVMSLPDTVETKGILTRERMALLPDGAYIVNVGRGSAIDEDALADMLESEHIAGAALDVFSTEPLPEDNRLWKTKNLLITPHVAGNLTLKHTLDRNVDMFLEDLENYAEGRQLKYAVDRKLGY